MSTFPRVVAITGATGLLGGALCTAFARRGALVRALVRDPQRAPSTAAERYRCVLPGTIDLTALAGADVVVHCAYMTQFTTLAEAKQVNEIGTMALYEAAREAHVHRFVFISSTSAHADAVSYYGRSKYALEQRLDATNDTAIRPGLILARRGGLFQRMRDSVRRSRIVPIFGGGQQILQTVHIDDLCEGIVRTVERELAGVVTIAEPEGVTMREFVRLVGERTGRSPILLPVPIAPSLLLLRLAEHAGARLAITSENLLGLKALRHVASAGDLARLDLRVRTARESLVALAAA